MSSDSVILLLVQGRQAEGLRDEVAQTGEEGDAVNERMLQRYLKSDQTVVLIMSHLPALGFFLISFASVPASLISLVKSSSDAEGFSTLDVWCTSHLVALAFLSVLEVVSFWVWVFVPRIARWDVDPEYRSLCRTADRKVLGTVWMARFLLLPVGLALAVGLLYNRASEPGSAVVALCFCTNLVLLLMGTVSHCVSCHTSPPSDTDSIENMLERQSPNDLGSADLFCSICRTSDEMTDRRALRLNCSHPFHRECLRNWAKSKNPTRFLCPNCRVPFLNYQTIH